MMILGHSLIAFISSLPTLVVIFLETNLICKFLVVVLVSLMDANPNGMLLLMAGENVMVASVRLPSVPTCPRIFRQVVNGVSTGSRYIITCLFDGLLSHISSFRTLTTLP